MPPIKSAKDIAEKWARVTPQRAPDYEAGVRNPKVDWAKATVASAPAYKEGIQKSIAEGRFEKGVTAAGTEKWQRRASEVGPGRYSQGVQAAAPDYEKGFSKFRDVIERTTLPARFAKGDPRNIERVRAMAKALHDAKRA